MVRVSVLYDKDIKEQVFMIRGDERYTRSTRTVIELGDTGSEDVYGFVQEIYVNVLRDYGDANIVIYDNDVVLTVIDDWTSTDTGRTIELPPITWDTPHKIQAKYVGNGRCSPSMSNVLEIDAIPNPHKVDKDLIAMVEYPSQSNPSTFNVGAWFDGHPSVEVNQPINFYLDGEYVDTVNISWELQNANITFTDVPTGLHTVKAEFEGSLELYAKSVTLNVSVGTKLTILSHPTVLVTGGTSSFRLKTTNFLDEPINHAQVTAYYHDGQGDAQIFDMDYADSSGILTLANTIPSDVGDGTFYFYDTNSNLLSTIKLPQFTPTTLTMDSTTPRLYKNYTNTFSVNINAKVEGVPVTLKEVNEGNTQTISSEVVSTNVNGVATFTPIMGKGENNRYIRAELGAINSTKMLEDYSQYWERKDNADIGLSARDYSLSPPAQLLELQNGFQIYVTQLGAYHLYINTTRNKPYTLELSNVSCISANGTVMAMYFRANGTQYQLNANHSNILVQRNEYGDVDVTDGSNTYHISGGQETAPPIFVFIQKTTFSKLTLREI